MIHHIRIRETLLSAICFILLAACAQTVCHADDGKGNSATVKKSEHEKSGWDWEMVDATGAPTARHEAALVAFKNKLYLLGGRGIKPVDVYDPSTNTWTAKSKTPLELHHFQAVAYGDAIYMIGAMTGPYPKETPLEKVVVYYPEKDKFDFIHSIPESRRRGGAGVTVYGDKILIAGGITNGHVDGAKAWLDQYDPKTGDWLPLADAPDARDHVQTTIVGDRLYFFAGRTTSQKTGETFSLTIKNGNVYDLKKQQWLNPETPVQIPTERAGNMTFAWGDEVIVGGGESASQKPAHREIEAFNVKTQTWRRWPDLKQGRHGSGLTVIDDYVYTAAGCLNRGGSPELSTLERLKLPAIESIDD